MNPLYKLLLAGVVAIATPGSTLAQHHHASEGIPAEALQHVGTVNFPISCRADLQPQFEQGVAMLHSFWYEEARKRFEYVAQADPTCAMAQWGLAMTEWRPFWDGMPEERRKLGIIETDRAAGLVIDNRERLYISALQTYMHASPADLLGAAQAYAIGMAELHKSYPEDVEAQAFYGLALSAVGSIDSKNPIAADRKALAILEPGFQTHPDHPGFAHYIIHTCDNPTLARDGLAAAREYAAIAPASAHAAHMPGHIFSRLGMWRENIEVNTQSVRASELAIAQHLDGAGHELHAYEFLLYSYLQDGDDANAKKVYGDTQPMLAHLAATPGIEHDGMFGFRTYVLAEFPSIYHLERHEWHEILALQSSPDWIPASRYYLAWSQAIAAGHLRDGAAADRSASTAARLLKAVKEEGSPIGAEADVTFLTVRAWQSAAHGNLEQAIQLMASAADMQDVAGQAEVDIPCREMLGELLLAAGRPNEALQAYRTALRLSPNRLNGLAGAALAAQAAKQPEEALRFYRQLLVVTNGGNASTRPEVLQAKAYLKSK